MPTKEDGMNAIKLAILFHELYEKYAPEYGYDTKEDTRVFKAHTPNGKLMIRVCREIQKHINIEEVIMPGMGHRTWRHINFTSAHQNKRGNSGYYSDEITIFSKTCREKKQKLKELGACDKGCEFFGKRQLGLESQREIIDCWGSYDADAQPEQCNLTWKNFDLCPNIELLILPKKKDKNCKHRSAGKRVSSTRIGNTWYNMYLCNDCDGALYQAETATSEGADCIKLSYEEFIRRGGYHGKP